MSLEEIMALVMRDPEACGLDICLLCGGPSDYAVLFEPTKAFARRLHTPADTERYFVYGICDGCRELPDSTECADALLLKKMQALKRSVQ